MFQITIDKTNYHTNRFSDKEKNKVKEIYKEILLKYPDILKFINQTLSPLKLTSAGNESFMQKVIFAFLNTVTEKSYDNKEQLLKKLKSYIRLFLPYIVKNEEYFHGSHCIIYEPRVVVCVYTANIIMGDAFLKEIDLLKENTFEYYYFLELISFVRTMKACVLLLGIGDDVHALSICRGAMEILSKLLLAENFRDEYTRFKIYNANLQNYKVGNEKLPQEMSEYLNNFPEYKRNPENFLAYGWAKSKKGKRITTLKEITETAFPDNSDVGRLLHISSEFVHEDYVGVDYDYITIRREISYICYQICKAFVDDTLNNLTKNKKKKYGVSELKQLFDMVEKTI